MQSAAGSRQTAGIGHARALDTTTRNFLPLPSRHEWGEGHSIRVASSPQPSPPLGEERDNISSGQAEVVSSNSVAGATEEGSNLAASTRVETKTRFLQAIASQVGPEVLFGRWARQGWGCTDTAQRCKGLKSVMGRSLVRRRRFSLWPSRKTIVVRPP